MIDFMQFSCDELIFCLFEVEHACLERTGNARIDLVDGRYIIALLLKVDSMMQTKLIFEVKVFCALIIEFVFLLYMMDILNSRNHELPTSLLDFIDSGFGDNRIENLWDAIDYFAADRVQMLLALKDEDIDLNEIRRGYHHTPLIACIHLNNYEAAKLLLDDDRIDVNKCDRTMGWTPLHECVRFGREEIAALLIAHRSTNIWTKSFENELPLDIGQHVGHHNECMSLIAVVRERMSSAIQNTVPILPKVICTEITRFTY